MVKPLGAFGSQAVTAKNDSSITLAFGGDVMLGRLVNDVVLERGPLYVWGNLLPFLFDADLTLVNLECAIAEGGTPFRPRRVFYFRASPRTAEALFVAGIDYVSLANNHAMDYEAPALLETLRLLDKLGIAHAGAGRNRKGAAKQAFLEAKGLKVGVVAFADHFLEYAAKDNYPGTNVIKITLEEENFKRVRNAIEATRAEGADLVVFSIHWGPNMRQAPTKKFIEFAHAVMDAGADIFHGHSAHLFQGIEIYKGKLILYDTGELIDDYYVDPVLRNDQQLLYLVKANRRGVQRVELLPLLINRMQVNLAEGEIFEAIQDRIVRLSRPFRTKIVREEDRLVIEIAKN